MSFQCEPWAFSLFIYSTLTGRQAILRICPIQLWWCEWQCRVPIIASAPFWFDFGQVGDCCEILHHLSFKNPHFSSLSLSLSFSHVLSLSPSVSHSYFTLLVICAVLSPQLPSTKDPDCPFASHHSQHGLNRASDKCPPLPCLLSVLSAERARPRGEYQCYSVSASPSSFRTILRAAVSGRYNWKTSGE